jgi:hypothetical protein
MNRRGRVKKSLIKAFAAVAALPVLWASPVQSNWGGPGDPVYETQVAENFANVEVVNQNIYKHQQATGSTDPVGVQLILALDTSGSMNSQEFEVELMATAHSINSEIVRNAIKYRSGLNSAAISVIDFDSNAKLRIPWVDIRGDQINDKPYIPNDPVNSSAAPDALDRLANEIKNLPRRGNGGTDIYTATNLSYDLFLGVPWEIGGPEGTRKRVVDVFGDGTSSNATGLQSSVRRLATMGVTVNGFAIINEDEDLDEHFREYLVTHQRVASPDGVVSDIGRVWPVARNMPTTDNKVGLSAFFDEVTIGMKQKISFEIAGLEDYSRHLAQLCSSCPPLPEPANTNDNPGGPERPNVPEDVSGWGIPVLRSKGERVETEGQGTDVTRYLAGMRTFPRY